MSYNWKFVCVFLQRKWHNETLLFNTVFVLAVLLLMEIDEVKQGIIIEWNHEHRVPWFSNNQGGDNNDGDDKGYGNDSDGYDSNDGGDGDEGVSNVRNHYSSNYLLSSNMCKQLDKS